jgi:tetratricopeptide (TPR) repeat protein
MMKSTMARLLTVAASGALLLAFQPTSGQAEPAAPKPKCSQHKNGSSAWKKCMGQASLQDDAGKYALGYWLAKDGKYAEALTILRAAENQADPTVQTMIGFSLRKLGHVDEAMAYYTAALSTNPELTSTRQYLGEAFLQQGDRQAARGQLAEIASRCGTTCTDYRLLSKAIQQAG